MTGLIEVEQAEPAGLARFGEENLPGDRGEQVVDDIAEQFRGIVCSVFVFAGQGQLVGAQHDERGIERKRWQVVGEQDASVGAL
ncbi:hypothetical protein [Mycobacterium kyorinense]|uniref:hypothetical protein n=1 Tax=Mycobacterium kyorinense TaxID=487514 RepID=UPI0034E2108B